MRKASYRQERENMSHQVIGIDHVAITVADMEIAYAFYERLFGAKTVFQYAPVDKVLVRQIVIGNTVLSIHQAGNGLDLVAKRPTIGGADFCWRWAGNIESALVDRI
jgi:catechol 2,3-dioxygenase-like lactoylglutathione lyase family enzyme